MMLLKLKGIEDTKAFVKRLAQQRNVFLVPATWAFEIEPGYLRLGLGLNPQIFKEGLERLDAHFMSSSSPIETTRNKE
jgi:aspartate/methionine/tyrosine aminotransferase